MRFRDVTALTLADMKVNTTVRSRPAPNSLCSRCSRRSRILARMRRAATAELVQALISRVRGVAKPPVRSRLLRHSRRRSPRYSQFGFFFLSIFVFVPSNVEVARERAPGAEGGRSRMVGPPPTAWTGGRGSILINPCRKFVGAKNPEVVSRWFCDVSRSVVQKMTLHV